MFKLLFIQLWNRKRANSWIFIELLLVFCLMWYIVDYFFVLEYNKSLPAGRSLKHTWQVDVSLLPSEHPEYQPGESDSTALLANYDRVLDRIRHFDGVEALAVLSTWSTPGSGSYYGSSFRSRKDTTRMGHGQTIFFDPTTDFFKVFQYTYPDGRPVSVSDFDWSDPRALVIGRLGEAKFFGEGKAMGGILESGPTDYYIVKGVVGDIKRFDYSRPQLAFYKPQRIDADNLRNMEIAVKSRESISDAQFLRAFKEQMNRELRIGNFYLKHVKSYQKINDETDFLFGKTTDFRIRTAMMLFFLLNIMLCIMGTFWYRIRVRREEIGLRMAMGSTRLGIRNLFFMEGICLLTIVMIPALLIEAQILYFGLIDTMGATSDKDIIYLPDRTAVRFILTNLLTWSLLAVTIITAIWLPAAKASKIAPAEALHDE